MRVKNVFPRFAEIETADDADVSFVRECQDIAEEIAPGRKIGASVVERHIRRVVGNDASHAEVQYVCMKSLHLIYDAARVGGCVGLAQVQLQPPQGPAHPPALLRRRRRHGYRQHDEQGKHAHTPTLYSPGERSYANSSRITLPLPSFVTYTGRFSTTNAWSGGIPTAWYIVAWRSCTGTGFSIVVHGRSSAVFP